MAMAVRGKNKHYDWSLILLRHWFSSAKMCRFDRDQMEAIVNEVLGSKDQVKQRVLEIAESTLSAERMDEVVYPIFDLMETALARLK
jgi:serine/threonine-protein kinase HipA